jgi:hypothetical protein
MTGGVCFPCYQQCAYMLFYKRILVDPSNASNAEERKSKRKERDVTEENVDEGDGEDGLETDDEFMVFGHDDVAWTGMEPDHPYNT